MSTPLPEARPPEAVPPTARRGDALKRVFNLRRGAIAGSPLARGVLLFGGLVLFTLLYALVLGWLSQSNDSVTRDQAHLSAAQAPAVPAQAPAVPAQAPAVPAQAPPVPAQEPAARSVALAEKFTSIDDAVSAKGAGHFTYSGPWQHLKAMHDGRSEGTSSRSFRVGASASFKFAGDRLKIFGVRGPNGGYAELRIDGETYGLLRFYAPHKAAGVLVYTSPVLDKGPHTVLIVVAQPPEGLPKRRFVNIDGASYAGR